jgi:hypothetical protein
MLTRFERRSALIAGPLAVALWIAGLIVGQGMPDHLSNKATDGQVLSWLHDNKTLLIVGGWLFATGCISFIWFATVLRTRLAAAEDESHTLSTLAYSGAVAAAIFGVGTQADIGAGINDGDLTAATIRVFHHIGDLFFIGAELMLILTMVSVAVLAFRTAVVPRWWGVFSGLVGLILWIGPIGWAALIFGTPIWVLGTTVLLVRTPRVRRAPQVAGAPAA